MRKKTMQEDLKFWKILKQKLHKIQLIIIITTTTTTITITIKLKFQMLHIKSKQNNEKFLFFFFLLSCIQNNFEVKKEKYPP